MKRKISKEDIIKKGTELMFLKGYHACGIKEITEGINIPKGSFYNHFTNKEEFGLALLQEYCNNGKEIYKSFLLPKEHSPITRLKNLFSSFINNYSSFDYKLGCLMGNFSLELGDINDNFRALLHQEFNEFEQMIAQCLDAAKEEGEIDSRLDTQILSASILNLWHGALVRMKSTGNEKPLTDFYQLIFNQILK